MQEISTLPGTGSGLERYYIMKDCAPSTQLLLCQVCPVQPEPTECNSAVHGDLLVSEQISIPDKCVLAGFVTSGLELWQGHKCAEAYFRYAYAFLQHMAPMKVALDAFRRGCWSTCEPRRSSYTVLPCLNFGAQDAVCTSMM